MRRTLTLQPKNEAPPYYNWRDNEGNEWTMRFQPDDPSPDAQKFNALFRKAEALEQIRATLGQPIELDVSKNGKWVNGLPPVKGNGGSVDLTETNALLREIRDLLLGVGVGQVTARPAGERQDPTPTIDVGVGSPSNPVQVHVAERETGATPTTSGAPAPGKAGAPKAAAPLAASPGSQGDQEAPVQGEGGGATVGAKARFPADAAVPPSPYQPSGQKPNGVPDEIWAAMWTVYPDKSPKIRAAMLLAFAMDSGAIKPDGTWLPITSEETMGLLNEIASKAGEKVQA